MNKFIQEFKEFALRGNVVDLAVGVVIGGAFKGIVDSLVRDIINPLLGLVANQDFSDWSFPVGKIFVKYGAFLSAIINFLLMALVIFVMVKLLNKLKKTKPVASAPETTKVCPYCITKIDLAATRCPHCTSMLEQMGPAATRTIGE